MRILTCIYCLSVYITKVVSPIPTGDILVLLFLTLIYGIRVIGFKSLYFSIILDIIIKKKAKSNCFTQYA
ncbi:hypothetical protein DXB27_24160 [Parabacteroides gordonii]|nr:hypothetical protein DXB27_24160 [Parabacteroides gordonii]